NLGFMVLFSSCAAMRKYSAVRQARRDESRRGRHERESALRAVSSVTNQHPKWAGEIAINCFQIRSLARSSQRVVSGKCLRHELKLKLLMGHWPAPPPTSQFTSERVAATLPAQNSSFS